MTVEEAGEYYVSMGIIKAREKLDLNISTSWTKLEKDKRNKLQKELLREADYIENKHRAATVQDIARIIGK